MRRLASQIHILLLQEYRVRMQDSELSTLVRDERGSALLEFALSATVLLTLVFGVTAMCMALYSYHFISDAAREGSRYAIVRGSSCTTYSGFTSACPVTAAQVQTYVQNLGFPGINPADMTVATTWSAYPAGGTCNPSASCNNPGNQVQVTVTYAFPLSIPFVPATTLTMSSRSQMVIAD
jgi:Flp pilus assembly protein TadG